MLKVESKFFTARPIAPGVRQIVGMGMEYCYLIEGNERALLVDTLCGVGNLKAYCRELTDLPILPVLTHGHFDHGGGAFSFGECFIYPDDVEVLYWHAPVMERLGYVQMQQDRAKTGRRVEQSDVEPPRALRTFPVYDGDRFDLGGRVLEAIHVPGHTAGSIVLLDRQLRAIFAGDALNCNTIVLKGAGGASVEEYLAGLEHLKTFQGKFDCLYNGHGEYPIAATAIDEAIELCDEILAGTDDAFASSFLGFPCLYGKKKLDDPIRRVDGKTANIVYMRDNIRKPEGPRVVSQMPGSEVFKSPQG